MQNNPMNLPLDPEKYVSTISDNKMNYSLDRAWQQVTNRFKSEIHEDYSAGDLDIKQLRSSNSLFNSLFSNSSESHHSFSSSTKSCSQNRIPLNETAIEKIKINSEIKWEVFEPENKKNEDKKHKMKKEESKESETGSEEESEKKENIEDLENLQFFKSILPDLKDFSLKEKRQLKVGVLKLIDEIVDQRKME